MASILTPRGNKLSRGTKSTPARRNEESNVEVTCMSLRSGKRKITNAEEMYTPQKENIMKRRKSNRVDVLKDATQTDLELMKTVENLPTSSRKSKKNGGASKLNNSVASLTPKLKDITQAVQNKLTKDVTAKHLESSKTNEKLSTPSHQRMKKKNSNASFINKSLRLQNDSVIVSTPKHKNLFTVPKTLPKGITPKRSETRKTTENLLTPSLNGMKNSNTSVIKKSSDLQNDSVIALTPKLNTVTKAVQNNSGRGKKKNAVHPVNFTEIDKESSSSAILNKTATNCADVTESDSVIILSPDLPQSNNSKQSIFNNFDAKGAVAGPSRKHMNDSLDSFVLEPLPDDASELVETSSDSEISMTLNTTYDLDDDVTQNATSNALSTKKSVHFKNSPEILGSMRRSNSFPNVCLDSSSGNISKNVRERISTPASRRRGGSNPLPSQKSGSSATKLPDFSLIHKRNFEKMESIYDFHHRRKGSSQKKVPPAGQEMKSPQNKRVMVFNATASSTPLPTTSKITIPPKHRSTPLKPTYSDAKEAVMRKTPVKKTPTHSAPVENNRNLLKGVRLNRRFELQMKYRNMK